MEIELTIRCEDLNEDLTRQGDAIRRAIFRKYPNAIWERSGDGHKIFI
jgi:hypothetical protein